MVDLKRKLVQLISAVTLNSYAGGFVQGTIYRGPLKQVCVPVLNCYSCPGAVTSCPIGSLQALASGVAFNFSFYVAGIIAMSGVLGGRFSCGWLCPFGLIQDLLYRIPFIKFCLPLWTRYVKYLVAGLFVLVLPAFALDAFGLGTPYFCKWLCPAGTLEAAIPLALLEPGIRGALGALFAWRLTWLFLILLFCLAVRRAFCRVFCPLGAILSLFNHISFFTISRNEQICRHCGQCNEVCYLGPAPAPVVNHPERIRCLKCVKSCPAGALSWNFQGRNKEEGVFYG